MAFVEMHRWSRTGWSRTETIAKSPDDTVEDLLDYYARVYPGMVRVPGWPAIERVDGSEVRTIVAYAAGDESLPHPREWERTVPTEFGDQFILI